MKVREIMEKEVVTISPQTTFADAAKLLYDKNMSGLPVVDGRNKLVGFVSEKDLFRVIYPYYKSYYESPEDYTDMESRENKVKEISKHPAKNFMYTDVATVGPDIPVLKAAATMLAKKVSRLPVVDEKGNILGIISRKMIYRAIMKRHLLA